MMDQQRGTYEATLRVNRMAAPMLINSDVSRPKPLRAMESCRLHHDSATLFSLCAATVTNSGS
jgi:hypothetical protein